jgi:O-antigen/teichoic acid export membrane protein
MGLPLRERRQVLVNAVLTVLQVLVLGFTPVLLYRFLLDSLGVELLGVWTVVLSSTTVTQVSELGLSSSSVILVAKYLARNDTTSAAKVVQTAMLSITVLAGMFLVVIYPFLGWLLGLVIPPGQMEVALSILPFSIVSLFITLITGVVQSGLDGCQRIDLRSGVQMGSSVFNLLICLVLIPSYGLVGLAYAYVIQAVLVLLVEWWLLRKILKTLPYLPHQWDRDLFREMLSYGINFQITSLVMMLYEPTTTALLSRFGGLAAVGYFQMAKRMVRQVRSLVVSTNQVVVPFVADLQEKDSSAIQAVYHTSYSLMFYLAVPLYALVVAITPLISEVWIGHYEEAFVRFSIILAVGWFLNTLNAPAYFANLGLGELRWNTIAHVTIAMLNGGLGLFAGGKYGGTAVVVAWVISLVMGSFLIVIPYHKIHKLPLRNLIPQGSRMLSLASVGGACMVLFFYYNVAPLLDLFLVVATSLFVFIAVIAVPLWIHPMRKRLMRWISRYILRPSEV